MKKYLNFICPTDFLGSIIRKAFIGEHYFLTSLGNSMIFDRLMLEQIEELLIARGIQSISFVLADDNRFLSDAMGNRLLPTLNGLRRLCDQVKREKEDSETLWRSGNPQFLISSYYLQGRIEELRLLLSERLIDQFQISAKIYRRQEKVFRDIHPDLII